MLQFYGHHDIHSKYLEFGRKILPLQFRETFHQDLDVIVEYSIYKHYVLVRLSTRAKLRVSG